MKTLRVSLAVGLLAAALAALAPPPVHAHPLGNFTVNRYARLELRPESLDLFYVLDLAEIPAFQEQRAMDEDGDGRVSEAEAGRYSARKAEAVRQRLTLSLDGSPVALRTVASRAFLVPGQAGLSTIRLEATFAAGDSRPRPSPIEAVFRDDYEPERLGWREIVVRAAEGVLLLGSTVSAEDVSRELLLYPDDLLSSPLNQREARFSFQVSTAGWTPLPELVVVPRPASGQVSRTPTNVAAVLSGPAIPGVEAAVAGLADTLATDGLSFGPALLALLVAAGLGAAHALSPGHGKTIVAAYLVGSRGTASHALFLGLVVTATHTAAVYALGGVTLVAQAYVLPERLYSWLALAAGALVLLVGGWLLLARLAHARHGHHHHHHHHEHQDGNATRDWRGLVALGVSGGLLPCPSALVLMLAAIALGQAGLGLVLIAAFSSGLALVLVGVGLAMVAAGRALPRLPQLAGRADLALRVVAAAPVLGALVITLAGVALTLEGLSRVAAVG